jgi:hypothetical protein
MTRNTFLKSMLRTGIGSAVLLDGGSGQSVKSSAETAATLENRQLALRVFGNGTFALHFGPGDENVWKSDPWEGVSCRLVLTRGRLAPEVLDLGASGTAGISRQDDSIRCVFGRSGVTVTTTLKLDGSNLCATVEEVRLPGDAWLVSVEYPFRAFFLRSGVDDGYLALASGEGCLIPAGKVKTGTTGFWVWHDASHSEGSDVTDAAPTLPMYGVRRGGSGYTAILETPDDFSFRYLINSDAEHRFVAAGKQSPYVRIACAWPMWLSSKGALGYARGSRFEFARGLDYNGMAKAYRKEARKRGFLVTLKEKERERPQINRLAGAPYLAYYAGYPHVPPGTPGFEYRYSQLGEVINDLAGPLGVRRAFVHFWGAYTSQPPACLPFDTRPGPVADLKAAAALARKSGYLFSLYNDISAQLEETSRWFPDLMWKRRDGTVAGNRRWTRICSSQFVNLLSRDFPKAVAELGLEAAYIDCLDAGEMRECYDSRHPLTRTEERQARSRLYRYVHSLGLIFGGEHAGWWNPAEIEYTNGVGIHGAAGLLNSFPAPLYQLTFHDALIPFSHAADDYTVTQPVSFEDKVLRDLLRGVPPMFFMNLGDHGRWRKKIRESYEMMSEVVKAVMYDELLSHEFVTDDQMVQRSRFSSGAQVEANFDEQPREKLAPKSFLVTGIAGGGRTGRFSSSWASS